MPRSRLNLSPEERAEHDREKTTARQRKRRSKIKAQRDAAKVGEGDSADYLTDLQVDASALEFLRELGADWCVTPRAALWHLAHWATEHANLVPPPRAVAPADRPKGFRNALREASERMTIRYHSFFSGADAAVGLAARRLSAGATGGWACVGVSQWEPPTRAKEQAQFAAAVLLHRSDAFVPNQGDINLVGQDDLAGLDVMIGGSPCQAFSLAGIRRGVRDPRGALTETFLRLAVGASCRPSSAGTPGVSSLIWENVPDVLSNRYDYDATAKRNTVPDTEYDDERDLFGSVLAVLGGLDKAVPRPRSRSGELKTWPRTGVLEGAPNGRIVAWKKFDPRSFGLPQHRPRLILLAVRRGDGIDPAAVLGLEQHAAKPKPFWRGQRYGVTAYGYDRERFGPVEPDIASLGQALSQMLVRGGGERNQLMDIGHANALLVGDTRYHETQARHGQRASSLHFPAWVRAVVELAAAGQPEFSIGTLRARLREDQFAEAEAALASGAALVDAYGQAGRVTVRQGKLAYACTVTKKYGDGPQNRPFVVRRDGDTVFVRSMMVAEVEQVMGVPVGFTAPPPGFEVPPKMVEGKVAFRTPDEGCRMLDELRFATLGNGIAVPVMEWVLSRLDAAIRAAVKRGEYRQERRLVVRAQFEEMNRIGYADHLRAWTFGGGKARFGVGRVEALRKYQSPASPEQGTPEKPRTGPRRKKAELKEADAD